MFPASHRLVRLVAGPLLIAVREPWHRPHRPRSSRNGCFAAPARPASSTPIGPVIVWANVADAAEAARRKILAQQLAAELSGRWGVITQIAADDALTAEQKNRHLVVMGWDNRLVDGSTHEAPFVRRADGSFTFAKSIEGEPADELLFMHFSPFNPQRWMLFWSRVDAEPLRFNRLPLTGADWSLIRDHQRRRRGGLTDEPLWPPTIDPTLDLKDVLPTFPEYARGKHHVLHAPRTLQTEKLAEKVLAARAEALERAAKAFGRKIPKDFEIHVYVYANADRKLDFTGVPDPVHVWGPKNEMHMVVDEAQRSNPQR